MTPVNRREFLQYSAAASALELVAASGCTRLLVHRQLPPTTPSDELKRFVGLRLPPQAEPPPPPPPPQSTTTASCTPNRRPWDFFSENSDNASTKIYQTVLYTVPSDVDNKVSNEFEKNVTIFADVVEVRGTLRARGKVVTITAREVRFLGGTLDVSGADATDPSPQTVDKGTNRTWPEAEGGKSGIGNETTKNANGQDAGQIRIHAITITGTGACVANGGHGAHGQSGGDGAKGATGPSGAEATDLARGCRSGTQGQRGGKGGRAGSGGDGGNGGQGGLIELTAVDSISPNISTAVNAGDGGGRGKAGDAGDPGVGGSSGRNRRISLSGPESQQRCVDVGPIPQGPPGARGDGPSHIAVDGKPGLVGSSLKSWAIEEERRSALDALRQLWDEDHLRMMVHRIELDYLQGDYEQCAIRAKAYGDLTQIVDEEISSFCSTVIDQLRQGLDFFGKPYSYVPLLRKSEIDTFVSRALQTARDTERAYDRYFALAACEEDVSGELTNQIVAAAQAINAADNEIATLVSDRPRLQQTVDQAAAQLDALAVDIQQRHAQFVDAVERLNRCDILDCIKAAGMVLGVTKAASASIDAIKTAAKVLPPGSHNSGPRRVEVVEDISDRIGDVKKKYQELKQAVEPKNFRDLDFQKLALKQDKYDKFLDQYKEMPEAAALRETVDQYFDVNQHRNESLLTLTASFTNEVNAAARKENLQQQQTTLRTMLTTETNREQQSANAKLLMGSLYQASLQSLRRALWYKRKIVEYAILSDVDFSVGQMADTTTLGLKNQQLDDAFIRSRSEASTRYRGFPFQTSVRILLVADTHNRGSLASVPTNVTIWPIGETFGRFVNGSTDSLLFSIPVSCPAFDLGWSSVRLTGVEARLQGVQIPQSSPSGMISVDVINLGVSQFVNPANERRWYCHVPAVGQVTYPLDRADEHDSNTEHNLVGDPTTSIVDNAHMGVSPFATWQLRVNAVQGLRPLLSAITGIELRFFGGYQGFNADVRRA